MKEINKFMLFLAKFNGHEINYMKITLEYVIEIHENIKFLMHNDLINIGVFL